MEHDQSQVIIESIFCGGIIKRLWMIVYPQNGRIISPVVLSYCSLFEDYEFAQNEI